MRIYSMMCAVLLVAGAACGASSQADEVRDARVAKIDEQTVSKTRAIEERQEAREEAIERAHDSTVENLAGTDDQQEATEETVDVAEERASYESDVLARWETIGIRINAAEQKMKTLGHQAPVKLETELDSLAKEHELLKQDVSNVPNVPAASWENATDRLDERLSELNERVKDLTDSIEDA